MPQKRLLPHGAGVRCLVAAAIISSTACGAAGRTQSAASNGDTLYVGIAAGVANQAYFRGAALAIERLNRERPANARPLGLRMPPEVQRSQVEVAAHFRDDPAVVGVVGHTGSAQTMEAAPIYGDAEGGGRRALVAVSPTATNPAVTRANEWVFRVCPTDDDGARALARFAVDSVRVRRLAVLYRNDLFGRGFTRVVAPALEALGVTVVERDPYLAGITEFDAYARRLAARGVDAMIIAGGGVDGAEMVRAFRKAGINPTVLGTDDLSTLGSDRESQQEFRGVRFVAFFDPARPADDTARAFVEEFERQFGQRPNHQAALSYDATLLIGRAAQAVGGDRRAVRDWIAATGKAHGAVRGVTGDLRFAGTGDAAGKPVLIGRVQ